jgi:hypothetical protein
VTGTFVPLPALGHYPRNILRNNGVRRCLPVPYQTWQNTGSYFPTPVSPLALTDIIVEAIRKRRGKVMAINSFHRLTCRYWNNRSVVMTRSLSMKYLHRNISRGTTSVWQVKLATIRYEVLFNASSLWARTCSVWKPLAKVKWKSKCQFIELFHV